MADISDRLRNQVLCDDCWQDANGLLLDAAEAIDRLRLTDEERAALHWFAHYGLPEHRAAALRGLLARLG